MTQSPENSAPTIARLAKELNGYVAHSVTCYLRWFVGSSFTQQPCTCGLTALQQQLAEEVAKGDRLSLLDHIELPSREGDVKVANQAARAWEAAGKPIAGGQWIALEAIRLSRLPQPKDPQ